MEITDEMKQLCKSKSLTQVAESLGYHIVGKEAGKPATKKTYHLKEMDSLVIFDDKNWHRYSTGDHGDQITFVMMFGEKKFPEAVEYLLEDEIQESRPSQEVEPPKEFKLPRRSSTERLLYTYLIGRGFLRRTIDFFKSKGLIYEEAAHHSVVLVSLDHDAVPRHGHIKGTNARKIRIDIPGSNKNFGFNLRNPKSDVLYVFEAAIDLMSYCQITSNTSDNFLALGGLAPNALWKFLEDEPHIKNVVMCCDADNPGIKGAQKIGRLLLEKDYNVSSLLPIGVKDWNELLQDCKGDKPSAMKRISINPINFNEEE